MMRAAVPTEPVVLSARGVSVHYGDLVAVHDLDLALAAGTVTALMGIPVVIVVVVRNRNLF